MRIRLYENDQISIAMKFYYLPWRYMTPFPFPPLRFHSSGFTYCYCRSVSSFSNAKAGIPDALCARTAMSLSIEKAQKSAENEYSSGNRHFSQLSRKLPQAIYSKSEFYYSLMRYRTVRNVTRDQFRISDLNTSKILPTAIVQRQTRYINISIKFNFDYNATF